MIYTVEITDRKEVWRNQQGQLHREDGPAIIFADGTKEWYRNDQFHREDGPAVIYADGTKSWYLQGERLSEEEFLRRTTGTKDDCSGRVVEIDGIQYELKKLEESS